MLLMFALLRSLSLPDNWSVFVEALQAGSRILVACGTPLQSRSSAWGPR